uniref:Chitin-binding type-4 domain-containing protein n=2 Tax=Tetranychus urticae TaxID=32264 RepID=T1KDI2_TETUR
MEMWCGGLAAKRASGGKCGVCGDPFNGTRSSEVPNGQWVTKPPTLTGDYVQGDWINVTVNLTAAHKGYFVFRLCPAVTDEVEVTQKCLNQYPLEIVNGSPGNRFKYNLGNQGSGMYNFTLILPGNLTCARCVLQWDYTCGNQGTTDMENETFRACADIRINRKDDEMDNEIDVTEKPKITKDTVNDKYEAKETEKYNFEDYESWNQASNYI